MMWPFWWEMSDEMKQRAMRPQCNFRYANSNDGGKGICVSGWYTCFWGAEWGLCGLGGWMMAEVLAVLFYSYLKERRDTVRVEEGERRKE